MPGSRAAAAASLLPLNRRGTVPGMEDWLQQLALIGQVAIAMLLGGLIGFERELAHKPAGFRTHMLVAGATALFAGLGIAITAHFARRFGVGTYRADPVRVMQAIVLGVSFLGAGTIFRREGGQVEGLTTAATILLASGVGLACALEHYVVAVGVTVLTLLVLRLIKIFEGIRNRSG
jgi:putative Mg2+ transporter-C (MgtC) family protein